MLDQQRHVSPISEEPEAGASAQSVSVRASRSITCGVRVLWSLNRMTLAFVRPLAQPFHDAHVHAHIGQEAHLWD